MAIEIWNQEDNLKGYIHIEIFLTTSYMARNIETKKTT